MFYGATINNNIKNYNSNTKQNENTTIQFDLLYSGIPFSQEFFDSLFIFSTRSSGYLQPDDQNRMTI